MADRLTPDQVSFFQREGYLRYNQPVMKPAKFAALKAHFEQKLKDWTVEGHGLSPEAMDVPHFTDPKLFEWLFDDDVLDLVESLIGPDIALWSSHFICKPPGIGKRVPWHEDSAYWGTVLDPMEVITVWLAIDQSTPSNGCMRVIPRTHHNGYSEYAPVANPDKQVFHIEIKQDKVEESKAVDMTLQPNECSIHHAKLIHGSNANTSNLRRCGYTMRYVPTTSRFNAAAREQFPAFQIYLARGKDRAGNRYGDPTKINEAWVNANPAERLKVKALAG
jgi:chlorinating enzyme